MCYDSECLCDVPLRGDIHILGDCVRQMWLGERLCEILGYNTSEHVWDDPSILKYLETLVETHDKWAISLGYYGVQFEDIVPLELPVGNLLHVWKRIRDAVIYVYRQFPEVGLVAILDKLEITVEEFIRAVTVNKARSYMSRESFIEFCNEMYLPNANFAGIGRKYDAGVNTMNFYMKLIRGRAPKATTKEVICL